MKYKAYVSEEVEPNVFKRSFKELDTDDLPQNEVLINVKYSGLNYKDGLSARGHKGITRHYPHTPGVDAAGIVVEDRSGRFKIGDEVVVTGHDFGMNTSGGFAEYARVPADWVIKLNPKISIRESMIYGTAGMTAALCLYELQSRNIFPDSGKILVTGSTGGVGCMAVGILAKAGYKVIASTGKMDKKDWLKSIGAAEVIDRREVYDITEKPLLAKRWKGAIDTVGGNTLSTVIRSTEHHGAVCCLGLVESDKFELNVYPFLMRGVTLLGIDSAEKSLELKQLLWENLAGKWHINNLEPLTREINLEDIDPEIDLILRGGQCGKVLIKI